jgi:type IV pilus assembly protein PilC
MAVFEYVAKDTSGHKFSGVYTDIESPAELKRELQKMGYTLVKAHKEKSSGGVNSKIKESDVVSFTYEFAGMYAAGLSITRCLETFEAQSQNETFKTMIIDIRQSIETGDTLKNAFEKYRDVFSDFFVGMLEAGEAGGKLAETLQMAAVYLEKQAETRRKVKAAFAYPAVVSIMCLLIVTALIIFVIPVFQKLYSQLHITLPLPTLILIGASRLVREFWWIATPIVAVTIFIGRKLWSSPTLKPKIDAFKLNMPVFGKLNRMLIVSRFVRTFAMMTRAGVPLVEAMDIAIQVADNQVMKDTAKEIQERIMAGSSLAEPMSKSNLFPPMMIQMAAAGEEAGVLPEMLSKGVDFLDMQIDRAVKSLILKLEPILSIVLGLVVGGILMGVYLPMFDYMGHVK